MMKFYPIPPGRFGNCYNTYMDKTLYPNEGMRQLVDGYRHFFKGNPPRKGFCALHAEQIAHTQNPHSMVISCFDSRVCPEAIFATNDGHICVHRNMLNQVDPKDASMMASLQFAADSLKVQNIIILGHSNCNAVAKLKDLASLPEKIGSWLGNAGAKYTGDSYEEAIKNNVLDQLARLRKIDFIQAAVQKNNLNLEGMLFHINTGRLERFDAAQNRWILIETEE